MKITYIDACHYKLTAKQAKALAVQGKLPPRGTDYKAVIPEDLDVDYGDRIERVTAGAFEVDRAWVTRTWWEGREVWCLFLPVNPLWAIQQYARSPEGREEAAKRRCWHSLPHWIQEDYPHLNPDYIPIQTPEND